MNELTNVTTGEVRLIYVHLFKPYARMQGAGREVSADNPCAEDRYGLRWPNQCSHRSGKAEGDCRTNGTDVCPPLVPTPVYDGDGVRPSDGMPFGAECKGHWVFTASAKADYPPEIVDKMGNPIINQSEIYSGIYGRVNVNFFPYAFGGKKGSAAAWDQYRKLRDGEPLGEVLRQQRRSLVRLSPHAADTRHGICHTLRSRAQHRTWQQAAGTSTRSLDCRIKEARGLTPLILQEGGNEMHHLSIDIETRSSVEIGKAGL